MEKNKLGTISQPSTLKEMGEFWDEHDFTEFDTDAPDVEFTISSNISIEPDLLTSWKDKLNCVILMVTPFGLARRVGTPRADIPEACQKAER